MSYQERAAGAQTPLLYALSLAMVFLCLAALDESWTVPTAACWWRPWAFSGSGAQRAIGTGVLGGMLAGTLPGLFFTLLFFVVVRRILARGERGRAPLPSPARG